MNLPQNPRTDYCFPIPRVAGRGQPARRAKPGCLLPSVAQRIACLIRKQSAAVKR